MPRIIRAPFFLVGLAFSFILAAWFFSVATIGAWFDDLLWALGIRQRPNWIPLAAGIVGYTALGIALPIFVGLRLLGWPGALLGLLIVLATLAILDRW